jgi:hypothetical protein
MATNGDSSTLLDLYAHLTRAEECAISVLCGVTRLRRRLAKCGASEQLAKQVQGLACLPLPPTRSADSVSSARSEP